MTAREPERPRRGFAIVRLPAVAVAGGYGFFFFFDVEVFFFFFLRCKWISITQSAQQNPPNQHILLCL